MWTGLAVCVVLLIVDVASVRWFAGWTSRQPDRAVVVAGGIVQVLWTRDGARLPSGPAWAVGRSPTPGIGWWPTVHMNPPARRVAWVTIPLWIPLVLVAMPTGLLWRRNRRPPPGHCPHCGYNLTGNVSGVCPECGRRI
jgi:hypothetical protein